MAASSLGEGVPNGHGLVEFRVRLMRVASVNPQYDLYPSYLDRLKLNRLLESFSPF
jgi:hypothetical protein